MKGCHGSCWGGVGWVMKGVMGHVGVGHERVGGVCHIGVGWVM